MEALVRGTVVFPLAFCTGLSEQHREKPAEGQHARNFTERIGGKPLCIRTQMWMSHRIGGGQ